MPREKLGEIVPRYSRAQLVRPRGLPLHRGLYVLSSASARDPSRTEVLLASVDRVEIDGTIRWVSFGLGGETLGLRCFRKDYEETKNAGQSRRN